MRLFLPHSPVQAQGRLGPATNVEELTAPHAGVAGENHGGFKPMLARLQSVAQVLRYCRCYDAVFAAVHLEAFDLTRTD